MHNCVLRFKLLCRGVMVSCTGWLGFHSICVRETLCDVYILCKEYHYESILDNSFRKLIIKHYFKANRIWILRLGSFSDAVDEVLNFPNWPFVKKMCMVLSCMIILFICYLCGIFTFDAILVTNKQYICKRFSTVLVFRNFQAKDVCICLLHITTFLRVEHF